MFIECFSLTLQLFLYQLWFPFGCQSTNLLSDHECYPNKSPSPPKKHTKNHSHAKGALMSILLRSKKMNKLFYVRRVTEEEDFRVCYE